MPDKYWENETPEVVETDRTILSWYPQAGKLQVSSSFIDRASGEKRRGKTATLDIKDLSESPEAIRLLERVLAATKGE